MHDYGSLRVGTDGRTLIAQRRVRAGTVGHRLASVPDAFDLARAQEIAAELARRWNAHGDLLAACEALLDAYHAQCAMSEDAVTVQQAEVAIAKAKPEA